MLAVTNNLSGCYLISHILDSYDAEQFGPFAEALAKPDTLAAVASNKIGSRIVQRLVNRMTSLLSQSNANGYSVALSLTNMRWFSMVASLLDKVASAIVDQSTFLTSNEFGNFVISSVIQSKQLVRYRNRIITNAIW